MTDRIKGMTITLDADIREDDVQAIVNAMKMIKGVVHVEPSIVTVEDHINREMIRYEFKHKLFNFVKEELK